MKRFFVLLTALVVVIGWSVTADAMLLSRLGGAAVYDTDLDITWLSDANAGAGTEWEIGRFGMPPGLMTWLSADAWAKSLTVGGVTGWRLPTTLHPDSGCTADPAANIGAAESTGYNCTGNEMGHLFYNELGGTAGSNVLTSGSPS